MSDRPDTSDADSEITERITLDIPAKDFAFLKQLALYRNSSNKLKLARVRKDAGRGSGKGSRIPAKSRKSLAESLLAAQCDAQRELLREAVDACGPMPTVSSKKVTPEERKAMDAWAKRVDAWDLKNNKQ